MDTRSQSPSRGPEYQWQNKTKACFSYGPVSVSSPGWWQAPVRCPRPSDLSPCPHYTTSTLSSEKAFLAVVYYRTRHMALFESTGESKFTARGVIAHRPERSHSLAWLRSGGGGHLGQCSHMSRQT